MSIRHLRSDSPSRDPEPKRTSMAGLLLHNYNTPQSYTYHILRWSLPWRSRYLQIGLRSCRFELYPYLAPVSEPIFPNIQWKCLSLVRDIYFGVATKYIGRFNVATLSNIKLRRTTSNESSDIIRLLHTEFDDLLPERYKSVDPCISYYYRAVQALWNLIVSAAQLPAEKPTCIAIG